MVRYGSGYIGSSELQVSVAMQEILPNTNHQGLGLNSLYSFAFRNTENCHVIINGKKGTGEGGVQLYLREGQGFSMELGDSPIHSFVVVESGVHFNWVGAY